MLKIDMTLTHLMTLPELSKLRKRAYATSAISLLVSACIAAGEDVSWHYIPIAGHAYKYMIAGQSAQLFATLSFILAFFGKGWTRLFLIAAALFEFWQFQYLTLFA